NATTRISSSADPRDMLDLLFLRCDCLVDTFIPFLLYCIHQLAARSNTPPHKRQFDGEEDA
ncbi:MAG: hypothetical protein KDE46_20510, partial [Caldilineaceae bacterium]|nr:hypothetical protein [Caldilineaceae bacterium]